MEKETNAEEWTDTMGKIDELEEYYKKQKDEFSELSKKELASRQELEQKIAEMAEANEKVQQEWIKERKEVKSLKIDLVGMAIDSNKLLAQDEANINAKKDCTCQLF